MFVENRASERIGIPTTPPETEAPANADAAREGTSDEARRDTAPSDDTSDDTTRSEAIVDPNATLADLEAREQDIETELQRYIGWPGQATAYKVGEIRLRAIRTRAETELGDRFDVRRFHDALLVDGPLPMDLLDQRMDRWIAEERTR